uniref:Uncharacterized protein n=1 Tax=Eptatretus burgeri TaxID=7764 RepID=A0A8C4QH47_EPTBU
MFSRIMWLGYFSFANTFVLRFHFPCDEKTHFRCQSGDCVTASWRCDGQYDCRDGSDEKNCASQSCTLFEFACVGGKCLPKNWVCDGEVDCTDRSDEDPATCHNRTCPPAEFACGGTVSSQCVPKAWLCDGNEDCDNGADEIDCGEGELALAPPTDIPRKTPGMTSTMKPSQSCLPHEFVCGGGKCLPSNWVCDGKVDCTDRSDEAPETCGEFKYFFIF